MCTNYFFDYYVIDDLVDRMTVDDDGVEHFDINKDDCVFEVMVRAEVMGIPYETYEFKNEDFYQAKKDAIDFCNQQVDAFNEFMQQKDLLNTDDFSISLFLVHYNKDEDEYHYIAGTDDEEDD